MSENTILENSAFCALVSMAPLSRVISVAVGAFRFNEKSALEIPQESEKSNVISGIPAGTGNSA